MTIKAAGTPLSFTEIQDEFGLPGGRNIGAYRVSQTIGSLANLPLDAGIPQSGVIKFSDFYGKQLNMVILYNGYFKRTNAREAYNNNIVNVVGRFTGRPSSSSGKKVFVNLINGYHYSEKNGDARVVAFRTGGWDSGTNLQVDIAGSAAIYGAGGDGGSANGGGGGSANSAIGIDYPTTFINRGYVQCGYGGGGAGGSGADDPDKNQQDAGYSGGGGGGGAGAPAGNGGASTNSGVWGFGNSGGGGNGGTLTTGGAGGGGGTNRNGDGGAGGGGAGGQPGRDPQSGGSGSGNQSGNGGGSGGSNGYAVISAVGGSYTFINYGTVHGGTAYAAVL